MTIGELSFQSVKHVASAISTVEGASRLCAAGTFRVKGNLYRIAYTDTGPSVTREGRSGSACLEFLTHRLAEGSLSAYADRLTAHVRASPEARLQCLASAMGAWLVDHPGAAAEQAVQRMLACYRDQDPELDLRNLGLETLPPGLAWLTHLTALHLGGNALASVPPGIETMGELRVLQLEHNKLAGVPAWFGHLHALQVLNLSGNRLHAWPAAIDELPRLAFVWVEGNGLTELGKHCGWRSCRFEVFARGNPLSDGARSDLEQALGLFPNAPIHHETTDGWHTGAGPMAVAPAAARQHGRLAVFVHDPGSGEANAAAPKRDAPLPGDLVRDGRAIFKALRACFVEQSDTDDRTRYNQRPARVMEYRIELLERHLAADEALYRASIPVLRAALGSSPQALLNTLDDVELTVVQSLLARAGGPLERLASLGRGVHRLQLVSEALAAMGRAGPPPADIVVVFHMQLARDLALPIEVRPIGPYMPRYDWPVIEEDFAAVRDTVLRWEAEDDGARLDAFMSEWAPWQALIRRSRPASIAGAEAALQELGSRGTAGLTPAPGGGTTLGTAASLQGPYQAVFRTLCREGYQAYRRGGEEGFARWCRQAGAGL